MATFLSEQLDFIFFFYGLAFILLGVICFAIAKGEAGDQCWAVLGTFGLLHGTGEWLDLIALVVGDAPPFAIVRIAVVTASFLFLMEFSRLHAVSTGLLVPRLWLHVPLIMLVAGGGVIGGPLIAGVLARYAIGLGGAIGASLIFGRQATQHQGPARRLRMFAAVGLALYAVAAGLIVPAAPFWPANVFNQTWFADVTGLPVQLVRGLLACWIAYTVWAIWGQLLSEEVSSDHYEGYLRRQFNWTLIALVIVLGLGWMLTVFLGEIYKQNVQEEAEGDIALLASHLSGETVTIDGMVKALAASLNVLPALTGGGNQDHEREQLILALDVEAAGAQYGAILDRSGAVVVASDRMTAASNWPNYGTTDYFRKSMAGEAGCQFGLDAVDGSRDYYASYPIRLENGVIGGVAVMRKSLHAFEADLMRFGRIYFFVDPDGVVMLTNRPNMLLKSLWPRQELSVLGQQSGRPNVPTMMKREAIDATWISANGERDYVRRRFANHSQWSLVLVMTTSEIFASRVSGIVMTLLATVTVLIYLLGRERLVRDNVQMDRRLKLQELAQSLLLQATTDTLTGLSNRLKFNASLAIEVSRSQRYGTPVTLVLFDIDHFKSINDTYGHQIGDEVLVRMSQIVLDSTRNTDLLARWGGEEFVILTVGTDGRMAFEASEKLRAAIEQAAFGIAGTVTCSFGIAEYAEGDTAETLIARADSALYQAKTKGRNRVELAPRRPIHTIDQVEPVEILGTG